MSRLLPAPSLLKFVDSAHGRTSFAEVEGATLNIDTTVSFHVRTDVDAGLVTAEQIQERLNLRESLAAMKSRERKEFLARVSV